MNNVSKLPGSSEVSGIRESSPAPTGDGCGQGPASSCGGLRYPKRGDVIYQAGSLGDEAFVCVHGLLKSRKPDPFGREVITQIIEPKMIFGVEALFGRPYATTVQAIDPSEVCGITRAALEDESPEGRALMLRIMSSLTDQLVTKDTALRDFALKPARSRAAAILLARTRAGVADSAGHLVVTPDLTRQDLAALAGMTSETFIRILSSFRAKGWVVADGRRITLIEPRRLASIAGVPAPQEPAPLLSR